MYFFYKLALVLLDTATRHVLVVIDHVLGQFGVEKQKMLHLPCTFQCERKRNSYSTDLDDEVVKAVALN